MRKIIFTLTILYFLLTLPLLSVYGQEDKALYRQGVKAATRGDRNSAFLSFDNLAKTYPKSRFLEPVAFALGEYYYSIGDFRDASESFLKLIVNYKDSPALPFAYIYLAKISRKEGKRESAMAWEREVIRFEHAGLIFSEFKEHKYQSAFLKKYRALYFVDRIEIYIDNELFAKITL